MDILKSLEQDMVNYIKQREVAVKQLEPATANVHALGGAIQALQIFIQKVKADALKAESEVKSEIQTAENAAKAGIAAVEAELSGAAEGQAAPADPATTETK